jgi:hypothetical protein
LMEHHNYMEMWNNTFFDTSTARNGSDFIRNIC